MEICITTDANGVVQTFRYTTKTLICQSDEEKISYTGDIPADFLVGKKWTGSEFVDVEKEEDVIND